MPRKKKTESEQPEKVAVSAPKGVEMYKVGVNIFKELVYAEKFAARKGLKVEVINA